MNLEIFFLLEILFRFYLFMQKSSPIFSIYSHLMALTGWILAMI
jgi:hypothetical protein